MVSIIESWRTIGWNSQRWSVNISDKKRRHRRSHVKRSLWYYRLALFYVFFYLLFFFWRLTKKKWDLMMNNSHKKRKTTADQTIPVSFSITKLCIHANMKSQKDKKGLVTFTKSQLAANSAYSIGLTNQGALPKVISRATAPVGGFDAIVLCAGCRRRTTFWESSAQPYAKRSQRWVARLKMRAAQSRI